MNHQSSLGVHLGVLIDIQGSKPTHFHYFIDIIPQKILSKNALHLSHSTKLILINTFLVVMISHILSSFHIPIGVANNLDSMMISFPWEKHGRKSIHWVKKDIVHLPKDM